MAIILKTKSIYLNDCVLIPKVGKVRSRKEVPDEKHKIIISPMLSVIGQTFIKEAARLGLSVALPRFISKEKKVELFNTFQFYRLNRDQLCFVSVGMHEKADDLRYIKTNTKSKNWLIDVANGYMVGWEDAVQELKNSIGDIHSLMVGNIVTSEGVDYLWDRLNGYCDHLYIRCGIGNGSCCASSDVTSVNRGQITEIMECSNCKTYVDNQERCFLVSDGGIYKSGFVLKAWGAGASYVLMGGYFSKAEEAECNINGDGIYFGCASEKQNKLAGLDKHSEGKEIPVPKESLKSLSYLVDELWGGIRSGISYVGYKSVGEFIGNGTFEIKINSLPPRVRY